MALHILYGMPKVMSKVKDFGFEAVNSQPNILNNLRLNSPARTA